jgi:stress response protein SCP2
VIDIINNALIKIYADRNNIPAGSKVYISPELQNYTIPFSLRSASRSIRTIGRGSVFNFDNTKTLRFFIYWKDNSESKDYLGYEICDNSQRIDIDLSAQYLNEAMQTTNWTSWTNLRSNFAYHSGDITRAPNGAAEFIDINCKEALANGIRYIVPQVYSFTYQKFCDMSECFFGWMERKNPNSGEIFEPKSVKEKIDLVNGARTNHPVLIDLFRGKIYWMDMEVTQERITERAFTRTAEVASAIIQMTKPTVYELLKFNAKGQCIIIRNRQKADVVFDEDFAYNTAEIIGKYL